MFVLSALIDIIEEKTNEISVNYFLEADTEEYEKVRTEPHFKHKNPRKPEFDFRSIFASSQHNSFPLQYVVYSLIIEEESGYSR